MTTIVEHNWPQPTVRTCTVSGPLLIRNCSWILTIHKARILRKKPLEKTFLDFKKWVKGIQTAGFNGGLTVIIWTCGHGTVLFAFWTFCFFVWGVVRPPSHPKALYKSWGRAGAMAHKNIGFLHRQFLISIEKFIYSKKGYKILLNLPLTVDWHYIRQK